MGCTSKYGVNQSTWRIVQPSLPSNWNSNLSTEHSHRLAPTLRRIRDARFKLAIRRIYHERCGLCNLGYHIGQTPLALEAAHVIPVNDDGTSKDVRNGLLLCSNHHTLFDSYAWTLDEDLRVQVTSRLGVP